MEEERTPPFGVDAEPVSLFELLCRSRAFWFGFAFWVGATVGLSVGFLWGVRAVISW